MSKKCENLNCGCQKINNEWKQGKWNTIYITIKSSPDKENKQTLLVELMSNSIGYHKNETGLFGQMIHTLLSDQIKQMKNKGYKIIINN
jgi:hypothetical protein